MTCRLEAFSLRVMTSSLVPITMEDSGAGVVVPWDFAAPPLAFDARSGVILLCCFESSLTLCAEDAAKLFSLAGVMVFAELLVSIGVVVISIYRVADLFYCFG